MDYVIQDCWTMISQDLDLVDTAIDQFSKQLTLIIRAQGGHIEHHLIRLNKVYTDCDKTLQPYFKIHIVSLSALTFTRYHILTSLQTIINTRLKKMVACCFLL